MIGQAFYDAIIAHCGSISNVRGVTEQSLRNLRDGKVNPQFGTLKKIFEANGMTGEIIIHSTVKGKTGKTKISLTK